MATRGAESALAPGLPSSQRPPRTSSAAPWGVGPRLAPPRPPRIYQPPSLRRGARAQLLLAAELGALRGGTTEQAGWDRAARFYRPAPRTAAAAAATSSARSSRRSTIVSGRGAGGGAEGCSRASAPPPRPAPSRETRGEDRGARAKLEPARRRGLAPSLP